MYALGIDVGSVSTDIVLLDQAGELIDRVYLRTKGKPIQVVQKALSSFKDRYDSKQVTAVGTTGSGRVIASILVGADIVKNEITTHAVAALNSYPDVRTVLEIGGQDSKIIIIRNGIVTDFAMNTVCAAGTGSFIDRQAERLEIPIEEFGDIALKAQVPVRIAGRCAVFAESDMIHKQQLGYTTPDIIKGLCDALVRNYMNNVAKGKDILPTVLFQGGVAANIGIRKAFEDILNLPVEVPKNHDVMGAIGSAILAAEHVKKYKIKTCFRGFDIADTKILSKSFICNKCTNQCEVVRILDGDMTLGYFGDRCGQHTNKVQKQDCSS